MKAVVMDINKKHMVVMKADGTFDNVKKRSGALIGDEITLSESSINWNKVNRYVGIAASIMLVLVGSLQTKAYYTPYGSASIDINPSIELGFNKYERVISVKALNEDGVKILDQTHSIKNLKLEDATKNIVETASKDDYIKKDQDNNIMVSLYTPEAEENKALNNKINNSVLNYLNSNGKKAELINETVSKEDINSAVLQKVSVGKLKLYQKAKQANANVTLEDIKNKPVRDIVKMINEAKKENNAENSKIDKNNIKPKNDNKMLNGKVTSTKEDQTKDEITNSSDDDKPENKDVKIQEKREDVKQLETRKKELEVKKNNNQKVRND